MREIKFRGRDAHGVWHYGDLLSWPIIRSFNEWYYEYQEVEGDTVGQFTGLKDCEGREIYEGDILQKRDELAWRTVDRGVVFWHSDECRWCVEMRDGLVFSLTSRKSDTWRVIGNVHDNPGLLR